MMEVFSTRIVILNIMLTVFKKCLCAKGPRWG
jgi:hypothetical protein